MDETRTTGNEAPLADTADTQASEADVANTQTPEATQEDVSAQEAATPETKAEDTVEEKLYAGKYKSVEELEKAYSNAESKLGATNSEKAELARILDQAFQTPEPQKEQTQSDDYDYEGSNTQADTRQVKLERDNAVMKFMFTHGDEAAQNAGTMKEILSSDPVVAQITGHEAKLEYAYQKSLNMARTSALENARQEGATQVTVKNAEKQAAQVESARKSEPVNKKAELVERMRYGDKGARAQLIGEIPAVKEMRRLAGYE
jgi:hypothetical protein